MPLFVTAELVVNMMDPLAALLLGNAPVIDNELVVTAVEVPAYDREYNAVDIPGVLAFPTLTVPAAFA